jgi:phosphoenolpyruvate carboxylase
MTPSTLVITQNEDVRFLGKLLGDVIREYGGEGLFRSTAIVGLPKCAVSSRAWMR